MGFKPKENTGKLIQQQLEVQFNREQFLEDVFNDEYILVVGNEVIMNQTEEPTGDVNKYILRSVNNSLDENYASLDELFRHSAQGVDAVRNLLNSDEYFSYEMKDVEPSLKALLETHLFPTVLTTTFDGYLEMLMRDVYGEQLRVVNIEDKRSLDELRRVLVEYRGQSRYHQPTLFYIFGKAVRDEAKKYVRTDDDAIQIIEKWIMMPKEDPIMKLIKDRKLLALGCKFDNWYFRFFWYILRRDISRFREGQVAFMLDDVDQDERQLNEFLKQSKIYRHKDARLFMSEITQWLSATAEGNSVIEKLISHNRQRGGIFLSYSNKDFVIARQIFFTLCKKGYNVWFDNSSLRGGEDYNDTIKTAIAEAKVFLPVLTPHIADDLKQNSTDHYYNREWLLACQLREKHILPIAVNGYDLRGAYHRDGFEHLIGRSVSGVDLMQDDGFDKLINTLDALLKK